MNIETSHELYVKVTLDDTATFVAAMDTALTAGWTRASDAEQRARAMRSGSESYYYRCDEREGRPPSMISIARRDAETLYVSNVVPLAPGDPGHDQYNAVLRDFHDTVLRRLRTPVQIGIMLAPTKLPFRQ